MLGNSYIATAFRFVILLLLQVTVLSRIGIEQAWGPYLQPLLYPMVILLLPVGMPTPFVLLLAFALGFSVDVFLGTYGMHAAALVFTGFSRSLVLALLEPREGYAVDQVANISSLGFSWFISYAAILMGIHTIAYFSIEVFTFVFISKILLQAFGSFCVSMVLLLMLMLVFRPKL